MAVFQPTAIIGNGRVLVTLGHSAELMAFFYPSVTTPKMSVRG
jgi:hypothetical protein